MSAVIVVANILNINIKEIIMHWIYDPKILQSAEVCTGWAFRRFGLQIFLLKRVGPSSSRAEPPRLKNI